MRNTTPISPIFRNINKTNVYFYFLVTVIFFFISLIVLNIAFANVNYEIGRSKKTTEEIANSLKKTRESRISEGIKKASTERAGSKVDFREENKQATDASKKQGTDISLSLLDVLKQAILSLERDTPPFNECRVLSKPLLPSALGLEGGENGVVDNIKVQYINSIASTYGPIKEVMSKTNIEKLHKYVDCIFYYSLILSNAALSLLSDIETLNIGKVSKDKRTVSIGLKDFYFLADGAIIRAYNGNDYEESLMGIYTNLVKDISDLSRCKFAGSPKDINCGGIVLSITANPLVFYGGMEIYGKGVMGIQVKSTLDISNSVIDSFSMALSNARYSEWAKDVQRYVDSAESQGRSVEALGAMKSALEVINSNKATVKMGDLQNNNKRR